MLVSRLRVYLLAIFRREWACGNWRQAAYKTHYLQGVIRFALYQIRRIRWPRHAAGLNTAPASVVVVQ